MDTDESTGKSGATKCFAFVAGDAVREAAKAAGDVSDSSSGSESGITVPLLCSGNRKESCERDERAPRQTVRRRANAAGAEIE